MKKNFKDSTILSRNCLRQLFFMMKLTLFFLITSVLGLFANGSYSQNTRISLDLNRVTVKEALKTIENQSEFFFIYNNELVNVERVIDLNVKDQKIAEVLSLIFTGEDVEITVMDRKIVLAPSFMGNQKEGRKISGRVTDTSGTSLPGVSVVVKGTTNGVITASDGMYSLSNVSDDAKLAFSFVGMKLQEIAVGNKTTINVILEEESIGIEEVVAVGYGTQKKKDITGSVSIVNMKEMSSIPSGSGMQSLQGQAAGVNIVSSGSPGASSQISVRGIGNFGNVKPLILIDGVEGDLENYAANDFESVQVLKDAGSAAIYGVRGSNGVIIVTTKKGKVGAPVVTYDAYASLQTPLSGNPLNMTNTADYAKLYQSAIPSDNYFPNNTVADYIYRGPGMTLGKFANAGDPAVDPSKYVFNAADPSKNYIISKVSKPGTNWFHEVFKPALSTNHNLNISGASENAKYMVSLNYLDQEGTLIETYLKRGNVRVNTEFNIGKHIRIGENVNAFYQSQNGYSNLGETNAITNCVTSAPLNSVYDIGGHFNGNFTFPSFGSNPVAIQKLTRNNYNRYFEFLGNVFAEVKFLNHFTVHSSIGGRIGNSASQYFSFIPYYTNYPTTSNRLSNASNSSIYYIFTNTLKYENTFGDHKVSVLAGSEAIENRFNSLTGTSTDFTIDDFNYLLVQNGNTQNSASSNKGLNRLVSYFTRLDYSYKEKYLLGINIRRDGSSLFGNTKYGVFPSLSLGWHLSNEQFLKSISWLSDLKIRGSYGVLGNMSNVNQGNAFTSYSTDKNWSSYDWGGTNNTASYGFAINQAGNKNTTWEEDKISNVGLDVSILKNKIDFTAEYYKKSIKGLLFLQSLASTAGGANPPYVNIGDIQNNGLDFNVTYRDKIGELNFTIGAIITSYKNKITSVPGVSGYFEDGNSLRQAGNVVRNQVGHSIGEFFGYQILGLFNDAADVANSPTQSGAAPGLFKYKDINGAVAGDGKPDGKITDKDRTFIGNPNPDFTYGLNLGLNYKNFDFLTIFYGSYGNKVYNQVKWYSNFLGTYRGGLSNDVLNAWTPENKNTNVPKLVATNSFSDNQVPNTYFVEDGSFFKCRSASIGYTFPQSILEKIKIKKVRVYVQGINLFQITKYSGLDPEIGNSGSTGASNPITTYGAFGIDFGNYPNNERKYVMGINMTF